MTTEAPHVTQRLSLDGNLCTIRYIGNVAGTKGTWLGVEWDDPSRGKHSGEHNGVVYFACKSQHPTAGSFIRPNRPTDTPVTVTEAVKKRYGYEASAVPDEVVHVGGKQIEEVGFDKIRKQLANLAELRVVVLDGCCVAYWDDIGNVCPNIEQLDLSRNLFEEFGAIWAIISQLPTLKTLRLDGNRFSAHDVSQPTFKAHDKLQNLTSLSVDDTLLTWHEITTVAASFPSLISITASTNQLSVLNTEQSLPRTISEVYIENNNFSSLRDIASVLDMPAVHTLSLKGNPISNIYKESAIAIAPITTLNMAYNQLSTWSDVDALSTIFPSMTSLRVSYNPLYKGATTDDDFLETVARLKNLTSLNHSTIAAKERQAAETFYLSKTARELSTFPESDTDAVLQRHPRYRDLCKQYGEPVIKRETTQTARPDSLAAGLVRCTFRLSESVPLSKHDVSGGRQVTRDVPGSFTVYNVLGLVAGMFGVRQPGLWMIEHDGVPLGPETRPLATLVEKSDAVLHIRRNEERAKECEQAKRLVRQTG